MSYCFQIKPGDLVQVLKMLGKKIQVSLWFPVFSEDGLKYSNLEKKRMLKEKKTYQPISEEIL